ncbi:2-oxo acid dehydrogenase subunit E2 [Spirochaeta isovalerica]|uniref:Dihydrolipoamide acetyltransferase component of pyruvate dehydrogenase complex n=1 Tax=Spirochaeta isovalerica TaxID=150 RepID=A0A841R7F9_9SPIO|nr:2-oxo acid dehydrogenase subunit E2 [Spirochaeta isovalerica]MBB6481194.1 pyruvate dehydrogenase E2 component (dihydrolipoamide acetyltransferase) [Spirochaeta isovalerica]
MPLEKIRLPDFGDVKDILIVEIFVSPGDEVEKDSSLMSLESDKAVMDLPSPFGGVIKEIHVSAEDQVNTGDLIMTLEVTGSAEATEKSVPEEKPEKAPEKAVAAETAPPTELPPEPRPAVGGPPDSASYGEEGKTSHATPSVRAYARELEIDLTRIRGTGPKGRILKSDVQELIKKALKGGGTAWPGDDEPLEDFSRYGDIEEVKLSRIKKISGPHLHKSWVTIPHVTHFDEADISELEDFRKELNSEADKTGVKYSLLVFVIKAVVAALKEYPSMNSSLVPGGSSLILKKYYNIGIAVDTPQGLVVPVIKNADEKGLKEISEELKALSSKAREGKLAVDDLQGATFSISSLGGIGGTAFTPIVNKPQVGILGLSRSSVKPVWDGEDFIPRLILPLSLSYDHRVIDGAEAARFSRSLVQYLEDLKRILL